MRGSERWSAEHAGLSPARDVDRRRRPLLRLGTMPKRTAMLALALSLLLAGSAAAKPAIDIQNGAMFGVRLGERAKQVRRKLGRPDDIQRVRKLGIHWFYERIDLQLFLEPINRRVDDLFTANPSAKTAQGIGVGSSEQQLVSVYPQAVCGTVQKERSCTVAGKASLTRFDFSATGNVEDIEMLPVLEPVLPPPGH